MKKNKKQYAALCAAILAAVIYWLRLALPPDAGPEYSHAINRIFFWAFVPLIFTACALAWGGAALALIRRLASSRAAWLAAAICGAAITAIPIFAPPSYQVPLYASLVYELCWFCGCLALALAFTLAAMRLNNLFSGVLCLFALAFLGFALVEGYYLLNPASDNGAGFRSDASASRHVLSGNATASLDMDRRPYGAFPKTPAHPSRAYAHHDLKFNRELFDARYVFDEKGHRQMPKAGNPVATLLLFGCSFTFGHGLENEETWAWLLSRKLGAGWEVVNYAFNGFGAQQMLVLLEEGAVEKPETPRREAFFLAIKDQMFRNFGLFSGGGACIGYRLRDGALERAGKINATFYYFVSSRLPAFFNGATGARLAAAWLTGRLRVLKEEEIKNTYVEILARSAQILREKYQTELTILVWPDIEDIIPQLRDKGVKYVLIRAMLKDWRKHGDLPYLERRLQFHPNQRAAREIAEGAFAYLAKKEPAGDLTRQSSPKD